MAGSQRAAEAIVDDAAFMAGLQRALRELELQTEADLLRMGHRAARSMKQLCPVDTGRLRNSIGVTTGRDGRGMYVDVGPATDYAIHVEYGTRYQQAQPFVRRGVEEAVSAGLR